MKNSILSLALLAVVSFTLPGCNISSQSAIPAVSDTDHNVTIDDINKFITQVYTHVPSDELHEMTATVKLARAEEALHAGRYGDALQFMAQMDADTSTYWKSIGGDTMGKLCAAAWLARAKIYAAMNDMPAANTSIESAEMLASSPNMTPDAKAELLAAANMARAELYVDSTSTSFLNKASDAAKDLDSNASALIKSAVERAQAARNAGIRSERAHHLTMSKVLSSQASESDVQDVITTATSLLEIELIKADDHVPEINHLFGITIAQANNAGDWARIKMLMSVYLTKLRYNEHLPIRTFSPSQFLLLESDILTAVN